MTIISKKKWMALAGLVWFAYVIFHALSLLNFHLGQVAFDAFYHYLNNTWFYLPMVLVLVLALAFHVYTASSRQLNNNQCKRLDYKKPYPRAVSRVLAWSGAGILLAFIILHFVQMTWFVEDSLYQTLTTLFSNPLMLLIYILGIITLGAHLHHALSNVLQTLGITAKIYHFSILLILLVIALSFASVLLGVLYVE